MTQDALSAREQDVAEIRSVVAEAELHQNDAERFTRLLTPDVVIVNVAGRRVVGRDEFHRVMVEAMRTPLAKVLTRNELTGITFLRPDVALVSCIKHISDENEGAREGTSGPPLPTRGSLTFVMVKEHDTWRIASAQTTPILR